MRNLSTESLTCPKSYGWYMTEQGFGIGPSGCRSWTQPLGITPPPPMKVERAGCQVLSLVLDHLENSPFFPGQERFTSMTRLYYRDASACVIMFDVTNATTFSNSQRWKQDLDSKLTLPNGEPVPCLLLANKVCGHSRKWPLAFVCGQRVTVSKMLSDSGHPLSLLMLEKSSLPLFKECWDFLWEECWLRISRCWCSSPWVEVFEICKYLSHVPLSRRLRDRLLFILFASVICPLGQWAETRLTDSVKRTVSQVGQKHQSRRTKILMRPWGE